MVHLVIVHGRSQEFGIPVAVQRPLEEGLRWGLERVGAPYFAGIPVSLAFYGDHWRPDAGALEGATPLAPVEPTKLQQQIAADLLAAAGAPGTLDARPEGVGWDSLNGFATFLDRHLHLGDLIVRHFLEDVESYFGDVRLRSLAIDRVADEVTAAADEVILLGHSLGSVVAYDTLQARPDLPVRGFITLGSPLGLPTVLRRLTLKSFPPGPTRWANVFDPDDFVTGRVALRAHYPALDSRAVEDLETEGRPPGLTEPTAAHDGAVYLSSIALAQALRAMVDAAAAEPESPATPEGVALRDGPLGSGPPRSRSTYRMGGDRESETAMQETADGAGRASAETTSVDYYSRLLRSRGGFEAAAGPPDLSEGANNERLVQTGAELHRIVKEELGDRPDLHGIVDQIVAGGDEALRVLRDGDEERLRADPGLVRNLEVIVKTDGSRPSFLIRNGKVARTTSPLGDWGPTLDDADERLQSAIACVGRINDPGASQGFQGTGFLIHKNLIVTNRHVLEAVATPLASGEWKFKDGVTFDAGYEHNGQASIDPRPLKRVIFTGANAIAGVIDHNNLDLALIELGPGSGAPVPKPLAVEISTGWPQPAMTIFTVGYPANPGHDETGTLLDQLFKLTFGHKRLAPGELMPANGVVPAWTLAHDATTLGGNSGSVVLVMAREKSAAGLHYGGTRGNPRENWGHVLGLALDTPGAGSGKTLREHFNDYEVELVNSDF